MDKRVTRRWVKLVLALPKTPLGNPIKVLSLFREANELATIFYASRKTAQRN